MWIRKETFQFTFVTSLWKSVWSVLSIFESPEGSLASLSFAVNDDRTIKLFLSCHCIPGISFVTKWYPAEHDLTEIWGCSKPHFFFCRNVPLVLLSTQVNERVATATVKLVALQLDPRTTLVSEVLRLRSSSYASFDTADLSLGKATVDIPHSKTMGASQVGWLSLLYPGTLGLKQWVQRLRREITLVHRQTSLSLIP